MKRNMQHVTNVFDKSSLPNLKKIRTINTATTMITHNFNKFTVV